LAVAIFSARRVYLASVIALGSGILLLSIMEIFSRPPGSTWYVLVVLTIATGWAMFRMPAVPVSFSISDTFTITAALLFGPAAGAVLVGVDGLIISFGLMRRYRTATRILFNITAPALAMWVSARLFFFLAGTAPLAAEPATIRLVVVPLGVFVALYFLLNTGLVALAVAGEQHASVRKVWREHFFPLWLAYFGGASIASLLVLLMAARVAGLEAITLVLPLLVLLFVAFNAAVERLKERGAHITELKSYAAALRSTADAVIVTDARDRVTLMNPMAERLTGTTEAVVRGRPVSEAFRLLDPATRQPAWESVTSDEDPVREYLLDRADGTTPSIEATGAVIRDEQGSLRGVIRTFRDVTQRKAIEKEREALLRSEQDAREAADAANRLKDEFLVTLSHELRTPATAILGWTRLLKEGRINEGTTSRALDALERSARAQAAVLNDLLDLSRIVRGMLHLDIRRIDLLEPLRDALDTVEPATRLKDIDLRVDIKTDATTLDADPDRLRQVFWNLLSNAIKFTPDGGKVAVSVARDADHLEVEVRDTGRGIDPKFLPHLFERFRQADPSVTREHGGLGIGLAIVRHVIEAHGGTVKACSDGDGRGACFSVRVPATIRRRDSDAHARVSS
jgi:PAS domain S-box-containing protein